MSTSEIFQIKEIDSPILRFIMNKKWAWVRHLLLVIIIALNFELFNTDDLEIYAKSVNLSYNNFIVGNSLMAIFALVIIYVNLNFLFYAFLKKGKYFYYTIGVFLLIFLFFIASYTMQQIFVEKFGKKIEHAVALSFVGFIKTVMYPVVFLASTTGYRLFKVWIIDQKRYASLKNQVNPHFLFNTLNNLHVLTKTNPDKASQIILGLSDVLRYQIYDSQHDTVLLGKDIEIIQSYIEIEKIRRDNLKASIEIEGKVTGILIPPLLFINFIDNAIKHSNVRGASFINILFKVENKQLYFNITNSKAQVKIENKTKGVGLANITKRLQLLFGEKHNLTIIDNENTFEVQLNFSI
jgi:hypothetical protein